MNLNLSLLENVRDRAGKMTARCPACAAVGADRSGEHLVITEDGRFGCILNPGRGGAEHRRAIWARAGETPDTSRIASFAPARPKPVPPKAKPRIPDLRPLTALEMAEITDLRDWSSFAGLELLTKRGLLWHSLVWDDGQAWPSWVIIDSTRRNAQARRLDGMPWTGIHSAKAKTLPGCDASWPIGAPEIGDRSIVLLCEGGPDFLAALLVAWWEGLDISNVAPVCVTGAGNSIHAEAIPMFANKRVRIGVHADNAGKTAAERWAEQLHEVGAEVDGFEFDGATLRGKPIEDLADFATLLDDEKPHAHSILRDLMNRTHKD